MDNTIQLANIDDLMPDDNNPRKADDARLSMLRMSLSKLGFILPLYVTPSGLLLSGHQRLTVAKQLEFDTAPIVVVDLPYDQIRGINMVFNRVTNDMGALDTGHDIKNRLTMSQVLDEAAALPEFEGEDWYANNCAMESIEGIGADIGHLYDKKAVIQANNLLRKGIYVPLVITERGMVVNGVHRLFSARENGVTHWPTITVPESIGTVTAHFLNYLSMDFHVDEQFANLLRYSAYRRPQNARGAVPKAYRFWANGERTLQDKHSYSHQYWVKFRTLHGKNLLDFGSGLSRVAPFLNKRGFNCIDFEPYRIRPDGDGTPDIAYSKRMAKEFLDAVSDSDMVFDSIFLASVINSIPLPYDRNVVLAIVNALCNIKTTVYGTCRDISDFNYEYGGIRQANYFVFDSEPGVRLGDSMARPKIQKFHDQGEFKKIALNWWNQVDTWKGGNIFYWRLKAPKRINRTVLKTALLHEFELPYEDDSRMGLGKYALQAFSKRLNIKL